MRLHSAWIDLALVLAVLVGAGLLFIGASSLPPPRFEPMGSAALPRILAGLLVFFALLIGMKAVRQLHKHAQSAAADETVAELPDSVAEIDNTALARAGAVFIALVMYVMALDIMQWPFIVVTPLFVAIVGSVLSSQRLRAFAVFGVFGIVLAVVLHVLMTRFLYVDLG